MSFGSRSFGLRDLAVNVLPAAVPGADRRAAQTACPGPTDCATDSGCAHPSLCQPPSDCLTESAGHTTAHCTTTQDAGGSPGGGLETCGGSCWR